MKYFIIKLSHDNGSTYLKTVAQTMEVATKNTMLMEGCPQSAVELKEVPKDLYSMNAKHLFNKVKAN